MHVIHASATLLPHRNSEQSFVSWYYFVSLSPSQATLTSKQFLEAQLKHILAKIDKSHFAVLRKSCLRF